MDWLEGFADALGVPRLSAEEMEQVLDLARVVAHGTERKNAPLATYLAGRAAGAGLEPGGVRRTAESLLR